MGDRDGAHVILESPYRVIGVVICAGCNEVVHASEITQGGHCIHGGPPDLCGPVETLAERDARVIREWCAARLRKLAPMQERSSKWSRERGSLVGTAGGAKTAVDRAELLAILEKGAGNA